VALEEGEGTGGEIKERKLALSVPQLGLENKNFGEVFDFFGILIRGTHTPLIDTSPYFSVLASLLSQISSLKKRFSK